MRRPVWRKEMRLTIGKALKRGKKRLHYRDTQVEESEEEKILVVGDTEKRCFNLTKRVRGNDKLQTTPGR